MCLPYHVNMSVSRPTGYFEFFIKFFLWLRVFSSISFLVSLLRLTLPSIFILVSFSFRNTSKSSCHLKKFYSTPTTSYNPVCPTLWSPEKSWNALPDPKTHCDFAFSAVPLIMIMIMIVWQFYIMFFFYDDATTIFYLFYVTTFTIPNFILQQFESYARYNSSTNTAQNWLHFFLPHLLL